MWVAAMWMASQGVWCGDGEAVDWARCCRPAEPGGGTPTGTPGTGALPRRSPAAPVVEIIFWGKLRVRPESRKSYASMGAVNSCFHRCTAPIASMVCAGRGWLGNLGQRSFGVGPSGGGAAGTTGGGGAASTAGAPPLLCGGFGKRVPKIRRCGFHEVFHERRTSAQGSARSSDLARFYRERDSQNSHFGTLGTSWRTPAKKLLNRAASPRCGGAADGRKSSENRAFRPTMNVPRPDDFVCKAPDILKLSRPMRLPCSRPPLFTSCLLAGGLAALLLGSSWALNPGNAGPQTFEIKFKLPPPKPLSPRGGTGHLQARARFPRRTGRGRADGRYAGQRSAGTSVGGCLCCEMRGYMHDVEGAGEDQPLGRIAMLEDHEGRRQYGQAHRLCRSAHPAARAHVREWRCCSSASRRCSGS